jgi:hypothetical protein
MTQMITNETAMKILNSINKLPKEEREQKIKDIYKFSNKLTNEEIEHFINNPLPPPIEFADRTQNGDFGLLPIELWNKIYDIKHAMEEKEYNESNKMIEALHHEYRCERAKIQFIKYKNLYLSETFKLQNCKRFINYYYCHDFTDLKSFHEYTETNMSPIEWVANFIENELLNERWYDNEKERQEERDFVFKMLMSKRPRKNNVEKFNEIMSECVTLYFDGWEDTILNNRITEYNYFSFMNTQSINWNEVEKFCNGFNFNHITFMKKEMEESRERLTLNNKEENEHEDRISKVWKCAHASKIRSSEY